MDKQKVIGILDKALEYEMGAMVKLLHHSFLVFGPGRGPIQALLRQRVNESIGDAIMLGEKITALGGHPSIHVEIQHPPGDQTVEEMLREDLQLEQDALNLYKNNLDAVKDDVALDQMFRNIITNEQEHVEECEKLLRQ